MCVSKQALIDSVFPKVHLLTPNKLEAEALLNRKLQTRQDLERDVCDMLRIGVQAV
jgi:hydroxymethylpyrimidine/phosphomethylpyrimidine kinase